MRYRVEVPRFSSLLAIAVTLSAAGPELDRARKYYHSAEFDKSLQMLQAMPAKDAAVWEMIGRNLYMQGDFKKSVEALEKAVAAEPADSNHVLWLGRAYGREAESASVITAPHYASKARQNFEKAVQLAPRNLEALSDLFEYYLEAPGFMGGGTDKAEGIAKRMAQVEPAEGEWAEARMAEKRKDLREAEAHWRRAAEQQPNEPGRFLDVARFLFRQGRFDEAERSFAQAEKLAPGSPKTIYARAETYIQAKRNLDIARDLLKRYMTLPLTDDDATRTDAAKLLQQAK